MSERAKVEQRHREIAASYYSGDVKLPAFLTAKNLRPFISKDLEVTSSQIKFRLPRGGMAFGYAADFEAEAERRGAEKEREKAGLAISTMLRLLAPSEQNCAAILREVRRRIVTAPASEEE